MIDAAGGVVTTACDSVGRVVSVMDQSGNIATSVYDFVGRLLQSIDPLGRMTKLGYDPAGRLVSHTTPMGFVTTYASDAVGRTVSILNPIGAIVSMVTTQEAANTGQILHRALHNSSRELKLDPLNKFIYGTPSYLKQLLTQTAKAVELSSRKAWRRHSNGP